MLFFIVALNITIIGLGNKAFAQLNPTQCNFYCSSNNYPGYCFLNQQVNNQTFGTLVPNSQFCYCLSSSQYQCIAQKGGCVSAATFANNNASYNFNTCCSAGQTNCGTGCCDSGQICTTVNNSPYCCPNSNVCGTSCCASGQTCIGGSCCPSSNVCGTGCCPSGQTCTTVNGNPWCCPNANICGTSCCPTGQCSSNDVCCSSQNPSQVNCNGTCQVPCNDTTPCCANGTVCVPSNTISGPRVCCSTALCGGNVCCTGGTVCQGGTCQQQSVVQPPPGGGTTTCGPNSSPGCSGYLPGRQCTNSQGVPSSCTFRADGTGSCNCP